MHPEYYTSLNLENRKILRLLDMEKILKLYKNLMNQEKSKNIE